MPQKRLSTVRVDSVGLRKMCRLEPSVLNARCSRHIIVVGYHTHVGAFGGLRSALLRCGNPALFGWRSVSMLCCQSANNKPCRGINLGALLCWAIWMGASVINAAPLSEKLLSIITPLVFIGLSGRPGITGRRSRLIGKHINDTFAKNRPRNLDSTMSLRYQPNMVGWKIGVHTRSITLRSLPLSEIVYVRRGNVKGNWDRNLGWNWARLAHLFHHAERDRS